MATYKTPGVFIEEISTLGSSIAGVPTAVTGFVGYTEKATFLDGTSAANQPVRITSLLEFQQIFGGAYSEKFKVTLTGTVPSPTSIAVLPTSITDAGPPVVSTVTNFILFYQIQMFYANGGGTCYIVSVGNYSTFPISSAMTTALTSGINKFEQIDEVTLLCAPETVFLATGDRKTVYNLLAAQCAKLQDRFAVLDTVHINGNTIFQDAVNFRNEIGADNLKYAATYYPALETPTVYAYKDSDVAIIDNRTGALYNTAPNNTLFTVYNGVASFKDFTVSSGVFVAGDTFKLTINGTDITLVPGTDYPIGADNVAGTTNLVNAINNHPFLSQYVLASKISPAVTFRVMSKIQGLAATVGYKYTTVTTKFGPITANGSFTGGLDNSTDKDLYNRISTELSKYILSLYPSASMAGVYARVDADRGVWKAPANVGLALVNEPSINITDEDQENLNVDSTSGKSINAIRAFSGRGTLVWGARTLAGNDNEWRYINVRRLFIYVEESCKKATEFVVFEANTANTWQRVKGMIEAFLTSLWRDGALAGATPKDAFFVNVGLGTTMTPQDILEGRMVVEIGLAAARPAEFIILRFQHKLQES